MKEKDLRLQIGMSNGLKRIGLITQDELERTIIILKKQYKDENVLNLNIAI